MITLSHIFGNDFSISSGSLETVSDSELIRQGLLRRLLTVPAGYIWQLQYGVGLPLMVGQVIVSGSMETVIRAQVLADPGVDSSQPVTVSVTDAGNGLCQCSISYVDAVSSEAQGLEFSY